MRGLKEASEPIGQSQHHVHAFMQDRHDQGRRLFAGQTENVVMLASDHAQPGMQGAHVVEAALAAGQLFDALF